MAPSAAPTDPIWFLRPRMLASYLLVAVCACAACFVVSWLIPGVYQTTQPAAAEFLITGAPTGTTLTPTLTGSVPTTASPQEPPPPPEGAITTGAYVQISGTGGDGLRLRDSPGLQSTILLIGSEAEIFYVADGPVEADGYTWWYLVGPYDENRSGWAVANFLVVVQNP